MKKSEKEKEDQALKEIRNDTINFQKQNFPFVLNKNISSTFSVFYTNWHTEPEFNLTIAGQEPIYIDNEIYVAQPGDIIAIEPNRIHTGPGTDWKHHCLIPSVQFLAELEISYSAYSFTPFVRDPKMTELFLDIVRAAEGDGPFQRSKTIVAAERFLLTYYTEYAKPIGELHPAKKNKGDAHFAVTVQVINYLRTNFANDFSIEEIADEIGVTVSYMCRCVKLTTGKTIVEHLNTIRCNAAYHYLTHSDKNIYEIAALCGFNGSSYFSKIYQQVMGVSPSEVRQMHGKK